MTRNRRGIEATAREQLQDRLDRYDAGVRVLQVKLEDVHPSIEVVDAFREVSDAFEEKSRLINEAEGYSNEQIALARGNAAASCRMPMHSWWGAPRVPAVMPTASILQLPPIAWRRTLPLRASISRPWSRCFPAGTS